MTDEKRKTRYASGNDHRANRSILDSILITAKSDIRVDMIACAIERMIHRSDESALTVAFELLESALIDNRETGEDTEEAKMIQAVRMDAVRYWVKIYSMITDDTEVRNSGKKGDQKVAHYWNARAYIHGKLFEVWQDGNTRQSMNAFEQILMVNREAVREELSLLQVLIRSSVAGQMHSFSRPEQIDPFLKFPFSTEDLWMKELLEGRIADIRGILRPLSESEREMLRPLFENGGTMDLSTARALRNQAQNLAQFAAQAKDLIKLLRVMCQGSTVLKGVEVLDDWEQDKDQMLTVKLRGIPWLDKFISEHHENEVKATVREWQAGTACHVRVQATGLSGGSTFFNVNVRDKKGYKG